MIVTAIVLGGIIGALLRYYVILLATRYFNYRVFYGTLFVNITGTFLIGCSATWLYQKEFVFFPWDKLILVGFLGAYTTFSSYILDTMNLWRSQQYQLAVKYSLSTLILGFLAAESGILLFRLIESFR